MAELSGFWTTGGSTGHQQASYTQSQMAIASRVYAACFGFEGVALDYLNELAGRVKGANTVRINTGVAMVDGRWYINDAAKDVNIPSAIGAGNTRIDRIVLRCTNSGYIVEITRIAGTDAAEPSPPAITQISGSVYDITLYQALVDTAGNVQLTDERVFAAQEIVLEDGAVTESKIAAGAVTTTKIDNDAVTNAKLADPYDVVVLKAVEADTKLTIKNNLINMPVPDVWGGKNVVRLWARLTGAASTSGDVVVRVYNETQAVTVGTVTITQGNRIGYTTSITNPGITADDILRVDVTSSGTGAAGLDVQVKVDKT